MPITTILMPLRDSDAAPALLETGLRQAVHYGARLDVLHVARSESLALPFSTAMLTEHMRETVLDAARKGTEAVVEKLELALDAQSKRLGVPRWEAGSNSGNKDGAASVRWLEVEGRRDQMIGRYGRLADLVLVPRPSRMSPPPASFEAALRDSGRPVLMVPRERPVVPTAGATITIGWNGSAAAAKAVAGALPMLRSARETVVLTTPKRAERLPSTEQLTEYLAGHGVKARTALLPTDAAVGPALLKASRDLEAATLVVGGYSRSRISDLVVGGVTRYLMANAELAVLLMH